MLWVNGLYKYCCSFSVYRRQILTYKFGLWARRVKIIGGIQNIYVLILFSDTSSTTAYFWMTTVTGDILWVLVSPCILADYLSQYLDIKKSNKECQFYFFTIYPGTKSVMGKSNYFHAAIVVRTGTLHSI